MKLLQFIRLIFRQYPLLLLGNTFLLLLANLLDAASIFSLIVVVDLFINPGLSPTSNITKQIAAMLKNAGLPASLGWIVAIFLFFNIIKIIFQIFAQRVILKTKYTMLRDILLGTFEDFFNARWHFFSSNSQGLLINTFIREMTVVGDAFSAMSRYFSGILQILLYLIVPLCISWRVTSVSLAAALFFAIPFFLLGRISYGLGRLNTSTANQISSVIHESLSLAKLVLGFANQKKSIAMLRDAFYAHRSATTKSQLLNFSLPLVYFPFGILVLIFGMLVARKLTLPLSEAAVLFYSLSRLIPAISNLTGEKSVLDNFFPSYEQITNLKTAARQMKQRASEVVFPGFKNEILIEGLSFAYPGGESVLFNINIRIPKGKMVAIIGESGAGKSTLIDALMGFHEPTSGRILFDGAAFFKFDINSYRRSIGYVPQDSVLFNMSVRDNLLWANEFASEEHIREACRRANAEEFIVRLPRGFDTVVGDRGVRLSGGQVQRIALARAILRKPELLILDEATSALDTHSERLIQQAIENIVKETTVIVVAHRLSTVINADYIYVLKNGRILEEGTYARLLQLNGNFSTMVKLQALEASKM